MSQQLTVVPKAKHGNIAIYDKVGTDFLASMKSRIQQLLPKMIRPERFMQIVMQEFRRNPKLLECTTDSLMAGILQGAREGLEPGIECYLIPRWNGKKGLCEISYQRDYKGDLALARRSGQFAVIACGTVHENDKYDLIEGTENRLVIRRTLEDRGKVLFYWCATEAKDGGKDFTVLSVSEAEQARDKFGAKDKNGKVVGPWVEHFDAMALKTVIKRHLKYQPRSYDNQTIQVDDHVLTLDGGEPTPLIEQAAPSLNERFPGETIDGDTGEVIDNAGNNPPAERKENSPVDKIIQKFIDEIDKLDTSLKVDAWRAKHNQKVARELPAEDDFNYVMAYANDRYTYLKDQEDSGSADGDK